MLASKVKSDIVYDIMTKRKLEKLKAQLAGLYGSPQRSRVLESVASRLGRMPVKGGDHGRFWVSEIFPDLPYFDIPRHSKPCNKGVVAYVVGLLEGHDVLTWEDKLEEEEQINGNAENPESTLD